MVLEGEESRVEQTIVALTPFLAPNALTWTSHSALALPSPFNGALVLRNVERLTDTDQQQLLEWMRDKPTNTAQVISTTSVSLYRQVCQGLFLRDLYYYLNTVRIELW